MNDNAGNVRYGVVGCWSIAAAAAAAGWYP